MGILAVDGTTVGTCGNCNVYQVTNPGMCQRYPTFVARQANETCGEWTPDPTTQATIVKKLLPANTIAVDTPPI